jgi:hypothetical protein
VQSIKDQLAAAAAGALKMPHDKENLPFSTMCTLRQRELSILYNAYDSILHRIFAFHEPGLSPEIASRESEISTLYNVQCR